MPKFGSFLKILELAPLVFGLVKQVRGQQTPEVGEQVEETRNALTDLKKQLTQRLESLEEANTHLKTRVRELESSIAVLKVLVYTSGVIGLLALIFVLIQMAMRH
ncbi:MAG TPA: hypothetical protein VGL77_15785 [Armatimonadota bacterium]